jgi:hypothetical protein
VSQQAVEHRSAGPAAAIGRAGGHAADPPLPRRARRNQAHRHEPVAVERAELEGAGRLMAGERLGRLVRAEH